MSPRSSSALRRRGVLALVGTLLLAGLLWGLWGDSDTQAGEAEEEERGLMAWAPG